MTAIIRFDVPEALPGEDVAEKAVWYESEDGVEFTVVAETSLSDLTIDPVSGKYVWESSNADTSRYQLVKAKTAGGVPSYFGALLPPIPDNPSLQTLTGNVKEFGAANWAVGDIVSLKIARGQIVNSVVLEPVDRTTTVNSNGIFSLYADKGAAVMLSVKYAATGKEYFSKSFTVSNDNVKDIKDY